MDGVATYIPFDTFPVEGTPLPKGKKGWVLMLDELSSCPKAIQAASYKIILDRMVGNHRIHPKVKIMAAGNLETDNAVVHKMSTALGSRLSHLYIKADLATWEEWALTAGIDPRILTFIRYKPELLHLFEPKNIADTFPCPRTWEALSDLIKDFKELPLEMGALINGTIGKAAGISFKAFCSIEVPTIAQILKNPENIAIPAQQGAKYFLACHVAQHLTYDSAATMMTFIKRMPIELQVIIIRTAWQREASIATVPEVDGWLDVNANRFRKR